MRLFFKLFVAGLLVISCNTQSKKTGLTIKEFTKNYADSLSARFPNAGFTIIDDSTIECKFQKTDISISVDNAFREYKAQPDSLQTVLAKYLLVASEVFVPKGEIDISRIVPIIKPVEYLDGLKKMGGEKELDAVYERYNEQLIVVFAEDTKSSIRYLNHTDIRALSLKEDSLLSIATRNLDRLLPNIEAKGSEGVFMLTAGGDYEASLILLDKILTKESFPVNGDFVIAIPTRDVLLITGSNDKAGIEKLKDAIEDIYETGSYQVSEYLYKWNGKIFKKYP